MTNLFETKIFNIKINADPSAIYSFVSNPENMPKWATTFCKSVKKEGADWYIETPMGPAKVKFAEKNKFGVLDHYVYPAPEVEVYVPMRVVPNNNGSELTFTLFKLPAMSPEKFKEDIQFVESDLNTLKRVMEQK